MDGSVRRSRPDTWGNVRREHCRPPGVREVRARGAIQANMGAGRDMGPGWIEVIAEAIADDDQLAFWVAVALDHNRALREQATTGGEADFRVESRHSRGC